MKGKLVDKTGFPQDNLLQSSFYFTVNQLEEITYSCVNVLSQVTRTVAVAADFETSWFGFINGQNA